ncbi:hypothetical protein HGM15179_004587 [Zosterops borbonicus]|uniref:Uncharacterized protein n=1 Tax=Zosterops borbonicus TaxID=364589 RepID=A0A8K1GNW1_9PASS|nr:hypothetical protein HGM15179_004587 [Zosterops borbonicus]
MLTVDMENKENGSLDVKNSVENGRPLDPADWAVTDVVNYFRTAGFEEQANAFQEQYFLSGSARSVWLLDHYVEIARNAQVTQWWFDGLTAVPYQKGNWGLTSAGVHCCLLAEPWYGGARTGFTPFGSYQAGGCSSSIASLNSSRKGNFRSVIAMSKTPTGVKIPTERIVTNGKERIETGFNH